MTGSNALEDTVALLLFQKLKEGMETGRIVDLNTAQTEIDAAIAELNRRHPLEESTQANEPAGKLILEIGSLDERIARLESQLAESESQTELLKEEIAQVAARLEACTSLLLERHQKVLAATEEMKASTTTAPPCLALELSPTDLVLSSAPSKMATVFFPGGPRTITIHPPGSPHYQSTIRDEKGDAILTIKGPQPLRREGAFRGPLENVDWARIHRVYGRGTVPDRASKGRKGRREILQVRPSSYTPSAGCPSEIVAGQQQLPGSTKADVFGRVLAPVHLTEAKSPSLPTGVSSSQPPHDPQSLSSGKNDVFTTPCSTPPSPSVERGKKRTRHVEEEETYEGEPLLIEPQTANEPKTPTSPGREGSQGPAKRKKLRASVPAEAMTLGSLLRLQGVPDVLRTV